MDFKQRKIYSNGVYSVIERTTDYGTIFSTVRWGSPFFERTFGSRYKAIEWCDRRKGEENGQTQK